MYQIYLNFYIYFDTRPELTMKEYTRVTCLQVNDSLRKERNEHIIVDALFKASNYGLDKHFGVGTLIVDSRVVIDELRH